MSLLISPGVQWQHLHLAVFTGIFLLFVFSSIFFCVCVVLRKICIMQVKWDASMFIYNKYNNHKYTKAPITCSYSVDPEWFFFLNSDDNKNEKLVLVNSLCGFDEIFAVNQTIKTSIICTVIKYMQKWVWFRVCIVTYL